MSKKQGPVPIPIGRYTLYSTYFGGVLFAFLGLFAIANSNWQIGLVAVISLTLTLFGWYWSKTSGNFQVNKKENPAALLRGVSITFLGVMIGDIVALSASGVLGVAFSFYGTFFESAVPASSFFSIAILVGLLTAISETMFFIVGAANFFIRKAGFAVGLFAVFFLTFLAHIPADGANWPVLTGLGVGFALQAAGGYYARDSFVPLGVHIVNNMVALGVFALLISLGMAAI